MTQSQESGQKPHFGSNSKIARLMKKARKSDGRKYENVASQTD